jgi:hypothetical protein
MDNPKKIDDVTEGIIRPVTRFEVEHYFGPALKVRFISGVSSSPGSFEFIMRADKALLLAKALKEHSDKVWRSPTVH